MNISKLYFLCIVIVAAAFVGACGTPSNPSRPDLVVVGRDANGTFDCAYDGNEIRIPVLNFGSDAPDSKVHIEFNNGAPQGTLDSRTGSILAGHTFVVPDATVPLSCLDGSCTITVHVDSDGAVSEGNEDNNIATCVIVVPG